ncbi:MAG: hypothetical protein QOF72_2511 [Blastocatellia bacterium]|nr:hypothetical protein [Blastocatellia bacterium]
MNGSLVFQFDVDNSDIFLAEVLNRMRLQRRRPSHRSPINRRRCRTRIEDNFPVGVVTDKIARAKNVEHTRPAMSVDRNSLARLDAGIQNPHALVFKQDFMMIRQSPLHPARRATAVRPHSYLFCPGSFSIVR